MADARPHPLPPAAVDGAIHWYVRLASGVADCEQDDAFAHWHQADPSHAEAWRRVEALRGSMADRLGVIPSEVSREVLGNAAIAQRRRTLKVLLWGGTGLAGSYFLQEPLGVSRQWHLATADLRTRIGEQKRLMLPDGTVLRLNTASAVDVRFDQHLRRIVVHEGELEIITAADVIGRQFVVDVPSARLTPIGTRFGVRLGDAGTLLTVQEGAVDLTSKATTLPLRVHAGYQVRFDRHGVGALTPLDGGAVAWADGLIWANRMALGDFLEELSRYRRGWIRCDASIAQLRLTALHTLEGPDPVHTILNTLPQVLPVSIHRVSPWLTLVQATKH